MPLPFRNDLKMLIRHIILLHRAQIIQVEKLLVHIDPDPSIRRACNPKPSRAGRVHTLPLCLVLEVPVQRVLATDDLEADGAEVRKGVVCVDVSFEGLSPGAEGPVAGAEGTMDGALLLGCLFLEFLVPLVGFRNRLVGMK